MTVSQNLAADLGVEARRLYEDVQTEVLALLAEVSKRLLAHPEQHVAITVEYHRRLRAIVHGLRGASASVVRRAILEAYDRGVASGETDKRKAKVAA